jgi:hypothetical protein
MRDHITSWASFPCDAGNGLPAGERDRQPSPPQARQRVTLSDALYGPPQAFLGHV